MHPNSPPAHLLKSLTQSWLAEDISSFDPAGSLLAGKFVKAEIVAKAEGILAGRPFVDAIFSELDCKISWMAAEGSLVKAPTIIAQIEGDAQNVLLGERPALNLLARLSGIATKSSRIGRLCTATGYQGRIAGTRKTTPGFRLAEKYALQVGGADPHRFDLSSAIMLKDNHIDIFGSISEAVYLARKQCSFTQKIEVECRSLHEAVEAASSGADIVMLDNFKAEEAKIVAEKVKAAFPHVLVEVSGGISEENIVNYLCQSIDVISMGTLTQDQHHIDFSMRIIS